MDGYGPYILLDDQFTHSQRYYTQPIDIITAQEPEDIDAAFAKLMSYHQRGFYIAGYTSYELGLIFEQKLAPLLPKVRDIPLLNFGIFEKVRSTPPTQFLYASYPPSLTLSPAWTEDEYRKRFDKVINYLKAGDVYQINLTFPMNATYEGQAHDLYAAFRHRQKGRYGGIAVLGNSPDIISLSPELFFRKESDAMSMRPMKGTQPRSADSKIDNTLRQDMRGDAKSQAENLMIVDLLRNDLSRISEPGSVKVPELYALETYPTLHQMTSRVRSQLRPNIDIETIFKNLYPCGSITGAPKIRAMEIIDELETTSRGAYCGALGYIDPNGDACFNVGIRTLTLFNQNLTYNVGSGLVLDSRSADEYRECLLKADVLAPQAMTIIETFRWDTQDGFIRGQDHKNRMKKAAKALGYPFNDALYDSTLKTVEAKKKAQHVRLTLDPDGTFDLTTQNYAELRRPKIAVSEHKLSRRVQDSAHKISRRSFYDGERERLKVLLGVDEVIFLNEDNKICEGSFTSIFIEKNGKLLTPKLSEGILPGILRAQLLKAGQAEEADIFETDLITAKTIYIGNSLRGLMTASLVKTPKAP